MYEYEIPNDLENIKEKFLDVVGDSKVLCAWVAPCKRRNFPSDGQSPVYTSRPDERIVLKKGYTPEQYEDFLRKIDVDYPNFLVGNSWDGKRALKKDHTYQEYSDFLAKTDVRYTTLTWGKFWDGCIWLEDSSWIGRSPDRDVWLERRPSDQEIPEECRESEKSENS